jgi:hypothetical protein
MSFFLEANGWLLIVLKVQVSNSFTERIETTGDAMKNKCWKNRKSNFENRTYKWNTISGK